jgi:hypothetical protein
MALAWTLPARVDDRTPRIAAVFVWFAVKLACPDGARASSKESANA